MSLYVALADASPITQGAAPLAKTELIGDVTAKIWPNATPSLRMQVVEPSAEELAESWSANDV